MNTPMLYGQILTSYSREMKRLIKVFVRWLLKIAEIENDRIKSIDGSCQIRKDKGFLVLTMPNGDIIPMQKDCHIDNNLEDRDMVLVTVTVLIPLKAKKL